ncbi:MAG: hypothetical protein ACKOE3_03380, partial [Betaproteobacteria bacterium]
PSFWFAQPCLQRALNPRRNFAEHFADTPHFECFTFKSKFRTLFISGFCPKEQRGAPATRPD